MKKIISALLVVAFFTLIFSQMAEARMKGGPRLQRTWAYSGIGRVCP